MLHLGISGKDYERLVKLATDRKMSVQRLARQAFLDGLKALMSQDSTEPYSENSPLPSIRHKTMSSTEICDYIRNCWQEKTDEQLAIALGLKGSRIQSIRMRLGLRRPIGRKSTQRALSQDQVRQLEALIKNHHEQKDDAEIGRLLEPNVPGWTVRIIRFRLGLKLRPNQRYGRIAEMVDAAEFERMVLREGYTTTEYLLMKGNPCTRQRLDQVLSDRGIKHSREDRSPEWYLVRRARKLGNMNLADGEWLKRQIAGKESLSQLAVELRIDLRELFHFVHGHKLAYPTRRIKAERESLTCMNCGKEFERLKRFVVARRLAANGAPVRFYCGPNCASKYDRAEARARREKDRQIPVLD